MKKKISAVLLSIIMILTVIQPAFSVLAASYVWTGGTSVPTLSGGYYQINTAEKLAWFANQVNSGSLNIKAKLTDDIMLNTTGSYTNEWTPIGSETRPFKGEFDGNGHYISGVSVPDRYGYSGLFGYVYAEKPVVDDEDDTTEEIFTADPPVMIHDLTVKNSHVMGTDNTGGICGYIHYGIIKNCSFSGTVFSAGNSVGGICGYAFNFSRILQCSSSGSVTGAIRTGGICGYAYANVQVNECYSTATVRSNASVNGNSGGIVGALSASTLKGCYFMGSISGPKRIGGIVGYNSYSKLTSCYVIAPVVSTSASPEYINAVAGYSLGGEYLNCYYCADSTIAEDSKAIARTLDDMKKFSFVRELNENASAFSFDYMELNNGYPVLVFMLETSVWAGGVDEPQQDSSGYYIINTPDNLAWFAKLVNGTLAGVDRNSSAKARVMDNLLFNIFITEDTSLTNEWIPIGTADYPFTGTFNGNGYNIAGVYTNGENNQGLFGYIGTGGTVSNVVMIDGEINGKENVGGIAGYNKGTISTSCNDGAVNGQKAIGGIAGYNTGTIQTSYNRGTVKCTYENGSQVGGICGYNSRATVKQCFNDGLVTGVANSSYYGGICGFNSGDGVSHCYNSGEVLGGFYIGGVVGYNSTGTIKYSLNYGVVNTLNAVNSNVNNFIGYNYGTCITQYCFMDSTIENSVLTNPNGAIEKTTDEMTGSYASGNIGLPSSNWVNKVDDTYFKYYPQLYQFNYSSYTKYREDSLESVRTVKSEFNVKLKIDGESDKYYDGIQNAVTAMGDKSGVIVPIRNVTVDSTVNIANSVILRGEGFIKTVGRGSSLTGPMFSVSGTLVLGDSKDGTDDNILLVIDGNTAVTASASVFNLEPFGKMKMYPGVEITNANSTSQGAAVYMDSDSTLDIYGGKIVKNKTTADGGAIYNDMGTLYMNGGEISENKTTAAKAGAIYNNSAAMIIDGGLISENSGKTYGGAIFSTGADSDVTVSGSTVISGNDANAGGGIFVNSGLVTMTGGEISENLAYKKNSTSATAGGGGGVTINTSGKFAMSGGEIKNNSVYNNQGAGFGVTVFGTFEMSKDALVTDNDIFVGRNRYVSVTDKLNAAGTAAVITPSSYSTSTQVLSGEAMGLGSVKFEVTPSGTDEWFVNSAGFLMNTPIENVASLSKFGAYAVDYVSVAQAVNAVAAGESGIITIIADNTINETIKVYGDVTILSETEETFTSMRGGSFKGTLFEVQPGGTLRFGFTEAEEYGEDVSADSDEVMTADSVGGEYILDGGYGHYQATGASMITVKSGGTLYTYDDFTMQNGYATSAGNISVSGTMYMYGGTFRNNTAPNGGAINIATTGSVTLLGGVITGNSVTAGGHGRAIYNGGILTRAQNIYEYYQNEEVAATRNTYVTVTGDNDVYLLSGKQVILSTVNTPVLLSESSTPPESLWVAASEMLLSAPVYYGGMYVLSGEDVSLHYNEFEISEAGYFINVDGSLGFNRLVPISSSGLSIDRQNAVITGIDISETAGYCKTLFMNTDPIEIKDINGNVVADSARLTTGSTISLYNSDGTEIADTVTVVIIGDVDCDGFINGMDSVYINALAQNMFPEGTLSAAQLAAADIDRNGAYSSTDVQYIETCGIYINTVDQNI